MKRLYQSIVITICLSLVCAIPIVIKAKTFIATNIKSVDKAIVTFESYLYSNYEKKSLQNVGVEYVSVDGTHRIDAAVKQVKNHLYQATPITPLKHNSYKIHFKQGKTSFEMWTNLASHINYQVTNNRLVLKNEDTFIATDIKNVALNYIDFYATERGKKSNYNYLLKNVNVVLISTDKLHTITTTTQKINTHEYRALLTSPLQNKSYKVYFKTNHSEFEMWTALSTSKNYVVQNNRLTLSNSEKTFTATNIKNVNTSYIDFYASERGVTSNINHPVQNISVSLIATDQSHIIHTTIQKLGAYDYRAVLQSPLQNKRYKIYFNNQNEMWTNLTSSKNYIVRNNRLTITNHEKTFIATNIQSVTPEYFTFYAANRGITSNQNSVLDNVGAQYVSIDGTHIVDTTIKKLKDFTYQATPKEKLKNLDYKLYYKHNDIRIEMWTSMTSSEFTIVENHRLTIKNNNISKDKLKELIVSFTQIEDFKIYTPYSVESFLNWYNQQETVIIQAKKLIEERVTYQEIEQMITTLQNLLNEKQHKITQLIAIVDKSELITNIHLLQQLIDKNIEIKNTSQSLNDEYQKIKNQAQAFIIQLQSFVENKNVTTSQVQQNLQLVIDIKKQLEDKISELQKGKKGNWSEIVIDNETRDVLWAKGVTPIPFENFKKEVTAGIYVDYKLPYDNRYGYFDTNKRRNSQIQIDASLCFGAVATNMLYWWLQQNDTEVNQFITQLEKEGYFNHIEANTLKDIRYLVNESGKQFDSRIYHLFVNYFYDRVNGYQTDILVDFFINGHTPKLNGGVNTEFDDFKFDTRAGFFHKVFETSKLTDRLYSGNYRSFSKTVKRLLENDNIIGLEHTSSKFSNHIVTLWGVEFNKNHHITAIYITDSDDQDEANKLGMKRLLVKDVDGRVVISSNVKDERHGAKVEYLHTLSLGKEKWKQYFQSK